MQSQTSRTRLLAVALLASFAAPARAQQPVVNFKTLQQFLPVADLPGYTRGKPTGQTTSAMGVSSSMAQVVYTRQSQPSEDEALPTITVAITDMGGNPLGAFAAMAEGMVGDVDEETEDGYRKSITVQTQYKGMVEATTAADNKSSRITLLVGRRFMVALEGYLTDDVAALRKLLDTMKLAQLERAGQAKG